jgi:LPS-assembly lipoprotein
MTAAPRPLPSPRRRTALLAMLLPLAGCGFALRRPESLPVERVMLSGFATLSPLGEELRRQLRGSGVTVVEDLASAQIVIDAVREARERTGAASTATGLVSDLSLRSRLRFRVRSRAGSLLIPETELLLFRDMAYSETDALAKEQEANQLYRAMEADLARQVLRRVAALPPQP